MLTACGRFQEGRLIKINKSLYLSVNVFSAEHKLGTLSRSNWNLEVYFILLYFAQLVVPQYLQLCHSHTVYCGYP